MNTDAHEGFAPRRPTPEDDARLGAEVDRAGHLLDAGDHAAAVTALGDVLGWSESLYGPADADVLLVRGELGKALGLLGRHYEAVDVLGPGVVLARELGPEDAETRTGLISALIDALRASGRGEETPSLERELEEAGGGSSAGGGSYAAAHGREAGNGAGGVGGGDGAPGGANVDGLGEGGPHQADAHADGGAHAAGAAHAAADEVPDHDRFAGPDGSDDLDDTGAPVTTGSHASTGAMSGVGSASGGSSLADDLRAAATTGVEPERAQELVDRADSPADRQLLPDALLLLAEARTRAEDPDGAVEAYARRAEAVSSLDGPTSGTALRAGARHVTALVEAGQLDEALDANMFLGRDARRYRPEDLELADIATARSADLLAAKGRFEEARQVFAELVALRSNRPGVGPEHLSTLDARHREAWATLEVDPGRALAQFEELSGDLERLLPPDHPLIEQAANGAEEARSDLAGGPAQG
ncbi:hypothetical protein ACPYO6_15150 [Georgenia sp. Z1344]|uniref:hypothetical protein n=1 Tax=Georgenia sp. Z1344 TaxID=3416706 RepID=UPI003CF23C69